MHGRRHHPTDTQQGNKQSGGCLTWRLAAVLTLGLALTSPSPGQAKTFHCRAGEVQCLIDAIHEANANGQKNTIRLAAGTYPLTTIDNDTDGPNGLPSITSVLTLQGAGAETTRLERVFTGLFPCSSVEPAFRILHVASTGVLILKGLTLRGGCRDTSPRGPTPGGGGLFTRGEVSLIQSAIVENEALSAAGGGILSRGPLTVTDSTIADNAALVGTGGGIESDGPLTVTRSHILGNLGDSAGGISAGGVTVIAHSRIEDNGTFLGGPGGITHFDGTMHITDSTIARNRTGGIWNSATLTLHNSTIAENEGRNLSGGIHNRGGMLTLLNSTIARNTTFSVDPFNGRVSAGIGNVRDPNSDIIGTVTVQNTILAQNTFDAPPPSGVGGPDCGGPITSFGTNLIGDPTDCDIALRASDLTGDPGLGDFTDNGKPGNGHVPLLPGSQAIDAGNDAVCPRRDQLGQRRVNIPDVGTSRCDIGAIEFQHRDKHHDDKDHDQPHAAPAPVAQATP